MTNTRFLHVINTSVAVGVIATSACQQRASDHATGDSWVRYELRRLDGENLPATIDDARRDGSRCTTTTHAASYELAAARWRRHQEISSTCGREGDAADRLVFHDSGALERNAERIAFTRFDSALNRDLEFPSGRLVHDTLIFNDGVPEEIFVRVP